MSNFEFDGEKYKQASKHQKEWGNSLISSLNLKGDEHVLDLGCGDGVLTEQIAMLVPDGSVLGVDASRGMINTALELKAANLDFTCLDIEQMDFDNQFDVIYSNAALHWVKNHEKLLMNCLKALKPNGYIAWNFAAEGTCTAFNESAEKIMNSPAFKEDFADFTWPWYMPTVEEYTKLVKKSGFPSYEVKEENRDRYFDSSDDLIKWMDQPSLVPFLQQLPREKRESFREKAIKEMLARSLLADGRCFETFRRINVVAYK